MRRKSSFSRLPVVLALVSMTVLLMCSDTGVTPLADTVDPGGESSQVSSDTPEVRFYPQDGRTHVIPATQIELEFNVDMEEEGGWSVWTGGVEYTSVSQEVRWAGRALIIEPQSWFGPLEPVTVTACGFISTAGVAMGDRSITFTVMDYGSASGTISPANGGTGVEPGSSVVITFTEAVVDDANWSVEIDGKSYDTDSDITWSSDGTVLMINPSSDFIRGKNIYVQANGFTTAFAGTAVSVASVTFTVISPVVTIQPSGTNVNPTVDVVLNFDVNVVNSGWTVSIHSAAHTYDVTEATWENQQKLIIGHADFTSGDTVTVSTSGFVSTDGYDVADNSMSFTVMNYATTTVTINPETGSTNIHPDARVHLQFSQPVHMDGADWAVSINGDTYSETFNHESAGISWDDSGQVLSVQPTTALPEGEQIVVSASGFTTQLYGIAVGTATSSFTVREIVGRYVVVGDKHVIGSDTYGIATSTDGINWSFVAKNQFTDSLFQNVTFGNGTYIAVGTSGMRARSTDGVNWTITASGSGVYHHIAFGNNVFVAVGDCARRIRSTDDGLTWTDGFVGDNEAYLTAVAYGENVFVAVGMNGLIMYSGDDGESWNDASIASTYALHDVTYGEGIFVAVTYCGVPLWSENGINWNATSALGDYLYGCAYGNGRFVAVGANGKTFYSDDGKSWNSTSSGVSNALMGMTYGNEGFVAVGSQWMRIRSPDGITWSDAITDSYIYPEWCHFRGACYGE